MLALEYLNTGLTLEEERYYKMARFHCTFYSELKNMSRLDRRIKRFFDVKKARREANPNWFRDRVLSVKKKIRKVKKNVRVWWMFWRL